MDYRKRKRKEKDKIPDKELGEIEISKALQNINKDDLLVSYDNNSLHPSAQIDVYSTWPKIETAHPFKNSMRSAFCRLFSCGRWNESNRCAFLTVKYHKPENLIFQQLSVKEKIDNPYKNNRLEENNILRVGIIFDTLTSFDNVEKVESGAVILEVYEMFFCDN